MVLEPRVRRRPCLPAAGDEVKGFEGYTEGFG
jgi:hypothetical protein